MLRSAVGWIAFSAILCSMSMACQGWSQDLPTPLSIWTGTPPGDEGLQLPPELDQAIEKPSLVAGKKIQRIGNVSQPTLQLFKPPKDKDTGTSVVILPGGGYSIVAYDLEGTEVAQWLNSIGVTGIVVKYRVPARKGVPKWQAAVQDAQRAVRTARAHAKDWNIDPSRIGVLGFSAGGDAAARTTLLSEAQYARVDTIDDQSHRPNFSILIYPAYLYDEKKGGLVSDLTVDDKVPPTFLVHAFNDPVTPESSLVLARALKAKKIPVELHLFDRGGHGYGLRKTENPVTGWPAFCESWLRVNGWLKPATQEAK